MTTLTPAHYRLIEAVAKAAAENYLREEALRHKDSEPTRPNHVPLPATDKAA